MRKLLFVASVLFLLGTTPASNVYRHIESSTLEVDSLYLQTKKKLYEVADLRREVLDIEEQNRELYEEVSVLQNEIINKLNNEQ